MAKKRANELLEVVGLSNVANKKVEFFVILVIPSILSQLLFMGTSGWNMPIQNIKLLAIAPMNML